VGASDIPAIAAVIRILFIIAVLQRVFQRSVGAVRHQGNHPLGNREKMFFFGRLRERLNIPAGRMLVALNRLCAAPSFEIFRREAMFCRVSLRNVRRSTNAADGTCQISARINHITNS
jgi:hypothetical protein